MPEGVRFWPPTVSLAADVRWAILRAFARPELEVSPSCPPDRCLGTASTLGLLPRICARVAQQVLRADLRECFESAARGKYGAVARGLLLERTLHLIEETAATLETPYALIKGAAIVRHLGSDLGLRGAGDIDILLHPSDAACMHRELQRRGFHEETPTHPHFHLPLLSDRSGSAIEIHSCLSELRLGDDRRDATLADLIAQGRVAQVAGSAGRALLPDPELLLAHALAHGIAQHGYLPQSYPLLRMVADIVDLAPLAPPGALDRASRMLAPTVSADEVQAVFELGDALSEGRVEPTWTSQGPAGRFLRHMVFGMLDDDYANGLKLHAAFRLLRGPNPLRALRAYGRSTFSLPDQDVGRIYGEHTRGKELRFKLLRPLDVTRRIARMIPSAAKIYARQLRGPG
jgi:hypothetical protein